DLSPNYGRVSPKPPLPIRMTQQYDVAAALLVFLRRERASHLGAYPQRRKKVGARNAGLHTLRLSNSRQIEPLRGGNITVGTHGRKALRLPPPIQEVSRRYSYGLKIGIGIFYPHQRFRMIVGQWAQQHIFDYAEDGRVGS